MKHRLRRIADIVDNLIAGGVPATPSDHADLLELATIESPKDLAQEIYDLAGYLRDHPGSGFMGSIEANVIRAIAVGLGARE